MNDSTCRDRNSPYPKVALLIASSFFLSACGLEGIPENPAQYLPVLGAANSEESTEQFTGELLSDGSIRLRWPKDPSAVNYLIMNNGELVATVPATELTVVLIAEDNPALNTFEIVSANASNVQTNWVSEPTFTQETTLANVPTASVGAASIIAPPSVPPTQQAVDPTAIAETTVEEIPPVSERPTVEETPPISERPPVEEIPPVSEKPFVEEIPPVVEEPPVEETPPISLVNLTPDITDTSYNCDPVNEAVHFTVGQTDHFTLSVIDESPMSLSFSVDTSNNNVVGVEVSSDGIFAITALNSGDVFLWLSAEDEFGLVDEYELRVIVQ